MRIAFYGSSLLSSYWNGAATYYRGLLRQLADIGHQITFFEPDAYDRQKNRDIDPPAWCKVVVYPASVEAMQQAALQAAEADVVVKASGVGVFDNELLFAIMAAARPHALRIFWDVDAPATLAEIRDAPHHPLRQALPTLDAVFTYGGGKPVQQAYTELGAMACHPVYNAVDPETHYPTQPDSRFASDLVLLANRLPDRERRIEAFFLEPAAHLPAYQFLLGGSGWAGKPIPPNVRLLGHVGTADHNALNCSSLAVLNVNRDSMAEIGFSPPTRIFEAAGAGACLISDSWTGIDLFLKPDSEILVARDGRDVAEILRGLTEEKSRAIGQNALMRILAEHTYGCRARQVDRLLRRYADIKRRETAA